MWVKHMQYGRQIIWTDVPEVTIDNVIDVLKKAILAHDAISSDIDKLIEYEAGKQIVSRVKTYRPDIDNVCVDNIANEVTEFNLGFFWGNPATFVQRAKDKTDIPDEVNVVSMLNEQYDASGHRTKTQENARFIEICGIGYTYIDLNTEWEEGDAYFVRDVLDPRTAFVVRSTYYTDHRVMLGVSFRVVRGKDGSNHKYYTCFTRDQRFEINNENGDLAFGDRNGELNPLGRIPIVEWFRAYDRMGCFERQMSEMDNLNLLVSDVTNDVEQNTQCIWNTIDVDFPVDVIQNEDGTTTEQVHRPQNGEWLQTYSTQDGKTPSVKPLTVDYDYEGMLNNIAYRRALILQKCNVPSRNDNSGGSTGIAMSDATGWSQAEAAASKEEQIIEGCMIEELKVVLAAIRECPAIESDNPLLLLKYSDTKPNFKRQKTYELTTKTNAIATLLSHGFSLEDCVSTVPLFDDPSQVVTRSGEGVKKYQETIFNDESKAEGGEDESAPDADKTIQDESDQIGNSPNLDGMVTNVVSESAGRADNTK